MNIKEIAKKAGVSSATISRVLNNSGYVKEETREKVMRAVKENNYIPSAIARSLSIQDNMSIGAIIPDIENEFFSKLISGISEVAEKHNYNIVFMGTDETQEKEHAFLKAVQSQRLKGIIIVPVSEKDEKTREQLEHMEASGISVVLVDRDIIGPAKFDGVFVDNYMGAYDAVTTLINEGHKRIAIITGPDTSKPGRERYNGYMQAMKDAGLKITPEYISCGDFKLTKAYECTKSLLELKKPPTAIFSSNNQATLGCLKYFTEHGIKLAEDISLFGFDDIEALQIVDYKISVVDRDVREQGREAMKLLLECFADKNTRRKGKRIIIPYKVILRGSEKIKK